MHKVANRPKDASKPAFGPNDDDREHGGQAQRQREFVDTIENVRRQDAHKDRAERSAQRNHQVEGCEIAGSGAAMGEFAVAEQAAQEKATAEQGHAHLNGLGEGWIVDRVAQAAHRDRQEPHHQPAGIQTAAMEGERESEQIQRERHNPQ